MRNNNVVRRPYLSAFGSASLVASLCVAAPARPAAPPTAPAPRDDPAAAPAIEQPTSESVRRFFASLTSVLGDALDRMDKERSLPESTWNPLEETKRSNADRLNELLDECAALLSDGATTDVRKNIRSLEREKRALDAEVRTGFEKQSAARPRSEREWYEVLGKSREDWEAAILAARKRQGEIDGEIFALRKEFAKQIAGFGLELGPSGHEALLATVSGDAFVDMVVAFDNVRVVTDQLRRITERMQESPETAKRYYGMYVLLVRIMDRIQDAFVEQIEKNAMPKIKAFGEDAAATERQAKSLLGTADGPNRMTLEKNVAACRMAQDAVANYLGYLKAQADRVRELNKGVEQRLKVAENTYRTMTVSVGIAELIRQGQLDLQAVMSMELPALKGFDNTALREQYERMNEQLGSRSADR